MKQFILCGVLLLSLFYANAQTSVKPLRDGDSPANGVSYYLPQAVINIVATAELSISKPGPFANYANRYLGVTNIITAESRTWQLKEVKAFSTYVADKVKRYQVAVNAKTTAFNLSLSADGVILGVNVPINTAASAAEPESEVFKRDTTIAFDLSQLGEEALVASSIPKMAEVAAKQIYFIRESRTDLLSGQGDKIPDGASLQLMLENLDAMERELVALFVGKTVTLQQEHYFDFTPKEITQRTILFRFSNMLGVVDNDNLAGRPIYMQVDGTSVDYPYVDPKAKTEKTFGLFYNVTGYVRVAIYDDSKEYEKITSPAPQFGYTAYLPARMFDVPSRTQVVFTPFGSIEKITQ